MNDERFRTDVEGLRAVAVLVVLLFHLGVRGMSGGFVGVDAFFVVSGFVVTRSLIPRLKEPSYRLFDFYRARFWRLQPSFFLVVAATLLMATFVLERSDLARAGKAGLSAIGLSANVFYFLETSGYDSPDAEESPFLQMWSLGVEEQFYLLWPWLLLLGLRFSRLFRPWFLWLLFATAVATSEWLTRFDRSMAYFLLPARLFELGLGSLLVRTESFSVPRWVREAGGYLGFGLLLSSAVVFDQSTSFPGLYALIPCFGTALLVQFGAAQSSWCRLLVSRPLRYLGRISYAVYLWHWAPIAFVRYLEIPLTPLLQCCLGLGSIVLGSLTHELLEQRTRRNRTLVPRLVTRGLALSALGLSVSTTATHQKHIVKPTTDAAVESKTQRCIFGARSLQAVDACLGVKTVLPRRVLIWGDSHSRAYNEIILAHPEWGFTPTVVTMSGCPPLFGVRRLDGSSTARPCQGHVASEVDALLQRFDFDAVLIVARFSIYELGWHKNGRLMPATHFLSDQKLESKNAADSAKVLRRALPRTVEHLIEDRDARVILALPSPTMPRDPNRNRQKRKVETSRRDYLTSRRTLDKLVEQLPRRAIVIDPLERLCNAKVCPSAIDGKILYRDDNHLSRAGIERLVPEIQRALERAKR